MEVILLEKVGKLGGIGDKVKVKSGLWPQLSYSPGKGNFRHDGKCRGIGSSS